MSTRPPALRGSTAELNRARRVATNAMRQRDEFRDLYAALLKEAETVLAVLSTFDLSADTRVRSARGILQGALGLPEPKRPFTPEAEL